MKKKRCLIVIDLANINGACNSIPGPKKIKLDFDKMINKLTFGSDVIGKKIYAETRENDEKFFHFLRKSGFEVITKLAKKIYMPESGETKIKANFDVEIAVDVCRCIWRRDCDHIFLFSGDSDFAYLVDEIQKQSIEVTVVSSRKTISKELSERANVVLIDDILNEIVKD